MKKIRGQIRAIVRNTYPSISEGRYAIKRVVGEVINVWSDVFADGHDVVRAAVQFKHSGDELWSESQAIHVGQDRWTAMFQVDLQGEYSYRFIGWTDPGLYWQNGLIKKSEAGVDVSLELREGLAFLTHLIRKADAKEKTWVKECRAAFNSNANRGISFAKSEKLTDLLIKYPYRPHIAEGEEYKVYVDREKAVYSTWYELFPRSTAMATGAHGALNDVIQQLPRIAEFGFDTLYLPPIHPIGEVNRKGKNNSTTADDDDVGSCWGIGSPSGGHKEIHPQLGSKRDFIRLVKEAKKLGIEIALDFALQVAPDHPWVREHPGWFKQRPDGSIQYAENPPKKYQDIFPIYFETKDWKSMWDEFRSVLEYWIELGIKVFRVDNPHTKPFGFWEWVIAEIKEMYPDVLFLAEAFTKPSVMQELGQLGFSQSYSYFTWRNSKQELVEYMEELTQGPQSESFRPNFWPNTPDILPWSLQNPDIHQYCVRYFLAATLSSNCGVYGPVYELLEYRSIAGKEEYWDSEKFQISNWDWEERNPVTDTYIRVNGARKNLKALQRTNNITFLDISNDSIIAYLKKGSDGSFVVCVVSLDGKQTQAGQLSLHPSLLDKDYEDSIEMNDLMNDEKFIWKGDSHFVQLSPEKPFHLLTLSE